MTEPSDRRRLFVRRGKISWFGLWSAARCDKITGRCIKWSGRPTSVTIVRSPRALPLSAGGGRERTGRGKMRCVQMKIVVLAGGLSPERNVSLSSGALVTQALRELGHRAALVDLFFGPDQAGEAPYDAPIPEELKRISPQAPRSGGDPEQPPRRRKIGHRPGGCWSCARGRTSSIWPSTGPAGRTAASRPPWTCGGALHRLGLSGLRHRHGQGPDQAAGVPPGDHPPGGRR